MTSGFPDCPKKCGGKLVPFSATKNGIPVNFAMWKCTNNDCDYQVNLPRRQ